jgi:hypothetical protein
METKSTIQQELETISPELARILPEKKKPPMPPKEYFDALPKQLLHRVKQGSTPVRQLHRYVTRVTVAASVAGLIILLALNMNKTAPSTADTNNITNELTQISNEELTQFLSESPSDNLPTIYTKEIQQVSLQELEAYYTETSF